MYKLEYILIVAMLIVTILFYEIGILSDSIMSVLYIVYFAFIMLLFKDCLNKSKSFFICSFLLLFFQASELISCIVAEITNSPLLEVGEVAKINGTSLYLMLYQLLFFGSAYRMYNEKKINVNKHVYNVSENTILNIFTIIIMLILIIILLVYGIPLFMNISRFAYWSNVVPWYAKKIYLLFIPLALCLGMMSNHKRYFNFMLLFFMCVISVLFGDKFSTNLQILYWFIIGWSLQNARYKELLKFGLKKWVILILGIITLFLLISYHYFSISGTFTGFLGIYLRIAAQGQLFYEVIDKGIVNNEALIRELSNFFVLKPEIEKIGIFELMRQFTIIDIDFALAQGSRASMGYPAIIIYYLGIIPGCLATVGFGLLFGKFIDILSISIMNDNMYILVLYQRIYILIIEAFNMGNLYRLFSFELLILIMSIYILKKVRVVK